MKKILISFFIVFISITLCACGKEDENKSSLEKIENSILSKEQHLDGLKFYNSDIIYDGANTEFVSTVKNTTDKTLELTWVEANIKYLDSSKIERNIEVLIYFGEEIPSGGVRTTSNVVDADLRKVVDIKYEIVR